VADGRIVAGVPVNLYMVFPRLFTCSSLQSANFRVEFEVNLIVQFEDNHVVTENFPITLHRTNEKVVFGV
jgi:hypothetical protein